MSDKKDGNKTGAKSGLLAKRNDGKAPAVKKGLGGALGAGKPRSRNPFASAAKIRSVDESTINTIKRGKTNPRKDRGYLGYIIDATGSRKETWNLAKEIQKQMFLGVSKVGNLSARVVAFRGGNEGTKPQIIDLDWQTDSAPIVEEMDKVNCQWGPTQIFDAVKAMVDGDQEHLPTNVVMIGDMCEEDDVIINAALELLITQRVKVFAFHEGPDLNNEDECWGIDHYTKERYKRGEEVYRNLAKSTGGAFAKFGPKMPLEDLCEAVGIYTAGKQSDFTKLMGTSKAAKLIGNQVLQITDNRKPKGPKGPQ